MAVSHPLVTPRHKRTETKTLTPKVCTEILSLPPGTFGDVSAMAEAVLARWPDLTKRLRSASVVLSVRTGQASIRVEAVPPEESGVSDVVRMRRAFPLGEASTSAPHTHFNETTHVFDYGAYEGLETRILFMAALPVVVADTLMAFAEALGIRLGQILRIELSENALARYYGASRKENLWLVFPLQQGVRVLALSGGLPCAAYFVGHLANRGDIALHRIWQTLSDTLIPASAVLLSDAPEDAWLDEFLHSRGVAVESLGNHAQHHGVGIAIIGK